MLDLTTPFLFFFFVLKLGQGIPEAAEVAVPVPHFPGSQTTETTGVTAGSVPGAPNSSPLNMFPQVKLMILNLSLKVILPFYLPFSVTLCFILQAYTLSGDNFWYWCRTWIS